MPYTLRKFHALGKAYADTGSVSCTCTYDDEIQHDGVIPTHNEVTPDAINPVDLETLFEFNRPLMPRNRVAPPVFTVTISVTGGTLIFANFEANVVNPADLEEFGILNDNPPSVKQAVYLDGTLIHNVEPADGWHYSIPDGSTLEFEIHYPATSKTGNLPDNRGCQPGDLMIGEEYRILEVGSSDFTLVGASENTVGTTFIATGTTTGDGRCGRMSFPEPPGQGGQGGGPP